ncbi:MAG: glycerol-3-phosphate 1-O-acyltransferase PlsY [Roseiflexaceae bacterium]|nr:glycerol-3-phosphate 1-O-acyltransferase PlsY [Roseiflexaceae bacterium]
MTTQQLLLTLGMMAVGYLAGSIPFSFIVARARGVDLRTVGSGNVGGSNVWRNVGFGPFVLAAGGDLLKGTLPTLAAMQLGLPPLAVVLTGVGAILGHTFPVWLGFKGGKAVATSGGVILALSPLLLLIAFLTWAVVFAIARMSSVASLTASLVVAISATIFYLRGTFDLTYTLFVWLAIAAIFYLHRENIKRILAGKESRFQKLF